MINTILVVDDDELMRANLVDVLTISNYDVYTASSGKEALSILDRLQLDLIITELIMSEIEGIELIIEIKTRRKLPVKIIAMTDGGRDINLTMARELGADLTLTKPFNIDILLEAISNL